LSVFAWNGTIESMFGQGKNLLTHTAPGVIIDEKRVMRFGKHFFYSPYPNGNIEIMAEAAATTGREI